MSRSLGPALTPALLRRLSQHDLPAQLGRAVPLITVDADGRPHPMLCSYLELLAVDAQTIRVAIAAQGNSARNLAQRGAATLLLIDRGLAAYVKCRAAGPTRVLGDLARFDLAVEDVLEDMATGWEEGVGITAGIAYTPVPSLDAPEAQAVLAALRAGDAPSNQRPEAKAGGASDERPGR